jgi:hypothetical protein
MGTGIHSSEAETILTEMGARPKFLRREFQRAQASISPRLIA